MFREYLSLLDYKIGRRDALEREITALAALPDDAPAVGWLQCFRGVQLHSAMVLATAIVDWRRFARPTQLMAYLGLVSRESSTGSREHKGSITKAGHSHCRHVLVQAAWSYRHRPQVGTHLKARQQGQPAAVVTTASMPNLPTSGDEDYSGGFGNTSTDTSSIHALPSPASESP